MILINIPLPTRYGWSYLYHKKLKKFLSDNKDIIYYPYISDDFLMDETKMPLNEIFSVFSKLSLDFIKSNYEFLYRVFYLKKIKKIILFDSMQGWKEQYNMLYEIAPDKDYLNSIFYVVVHTDPSYINLTQDKYEFVEYSEIPNLITVSNKSINLFKNFFNENNLKCPNLYFLPNIVDIPDKFEQKIPRSIFWAGRITNVSKNFDLLYDIVKSLPDYTFYVPVQYDALNVVSLNLALKGDYENLKFVVTDNSEHTMSIAKKCKYVLSTAKCETFGIMIVESMLNGAVPLIPSTLKNSYVYTLSPSEFIYSNVSGIKNILKISNSYSFNYYYGYYVPMRSKYEKDLENYKQVLE